MRQPTPGLDWLDVAVNSQPGFWESMLDRISSQGSLAGLSTREPDDSLIGLFDAAATMLDVLSFYGERITNEAFIRTAQERRSVLELAELIGYKLAPGVAASTSFVVEVEPPPGVGEDVAIRAGLPVQKLPGEDQVAAIYESSTDLVARKDFNVLRPVIVEPERPQFGSLSIALDGTGLGLTAGDQLVLVGDERADDATSERWELRTVVDTEEVTTDPSITSDAIPSRTIVTFDRPLGHIAPHVDPTASGATCHLLTRSGALFGSAAVRWHDLPVGLRVGELNPDPASSNVFLAGPYAGQENTWVDANLRAGTRQLWLDRVYKDIAVDSWIVLTRTGYQELYRVTNAQHGSRNAYMMSGPSTRVRLDGSENIELFSIRNAIVFCGSRELPLASVPRSTPLGGSSMIVHGHVDVPEDRVVSLAGTDAATGEPIAEELVVKQSTIDHVGETTEIEFTTATVHTYRPEGCRLHANVVDANHGQTVRSQPIGSGNASTEFLTLSLPTTTDAPLTYVAASSPTGRASSLEVRVDGVLWNEVPTLAYSSSEDRVFTVRHRDDGAVSIQFGDGLTGARPGSGDNNITATWRTGVGTPGRALAEQISLPLGMPLGLKTVINHLAATGSEDPETLATARVNAPTTIKALGRIVSLPDVEDFARTFAGVGWANAQALDDGDQPIVVLSVALADGSPLLAGSQTEERLIEALDLARIADRPIVVRGHVNRPVDVEVVVEFDPSHPAEELHVAVTAAVVGLFDHTPRLGVSGGFGQLLTPTIVHGALHEISGVRGVALRRLNSGRSRSRVSEVLAQPARFSGGAVQPAELLVPGVLTILEGVL